MENPVKPWLRIHDVLYAFESTDPSDAALVHALRLASFARARLSLMCLKPQDTRKDEDVFPDVRAMLVRWASVNPAAALSGDLEIRRLRATIDNPVEACVRFLEKSPTDMIVVSASGHERETSWLRRPLAEDLSRKAGEVTLFLPAGAAGFVGPEDGKANLRTILIPVAKRPRPQPALEAARRLMVSVPQVAGTALVLHVGPRSDMPEIELPSVAGWSWKKINLEGDVAEKILQTADENKADVISMATAGHHGFLDALRGSTTMQVLRGARCALMSMPEGSFLG